MVATNALIFQRGEETLATLTLSCTLFFDTLAVSDSLADVVSRAVELVAPHATWYRAGDMSRNAPADPRALSHARDLLGAALTTKTDYFLTVDSGVLLDSVGSWSLKYSSAPSYEGDVVGYLQFHVDQAFVAPPVFLQHVRSWVETVNFLHGYAGLSVNYDHGDVDQARNIAMRGFCERHLGVNLSDLVTERRALAGRIKNAQWLTFVGTALLREHETKARQLRSLDRTMLTAQGLLIQACEEPLLGDTHRGENVAPYIDVNAQLKPWLVDNLFPLPGFPDEESTRAWLHKLRPWTV
jgi:hypothetical protein